MAYELLIGLHVTDEAGYQAYRDAMRPILESYGGGFRYDFQISETLASQANHKINRLFTIYFKDKAARNGFFNDPAYKKVRAKHFTPSVAGSTVIGTLEKG